MTHRVPFQPLPFCDSVKAVTALTSAVFEYLTNFKTSIVSNLLTVP